MNHENHLRDPGGRFDCSLIECGLTAGLPSNISIRPSDCDRPAIPTSVSSGFLEPACVSRLISIDALAIGPEIDPGVLSARSLAGTSPVPALKSGDCGNSDFYPKAWAMLR